MIIKDFNQAQKFLYKQIPSGVKRPFPGALGLNRTKFLLKLLDNPQEKIKIIHLAGTSGKGSTAYLTSLILTSLGFKVGLHLSPHLQDIRERTQINNQLISQKKFIFYLNHLLAPIQKTANSKYGLPTYFEILVSLAFYAFWQEKVDYAVMETGMGGWYDATNVVKNPAKLAIITRIGFDHTNVLGKTYSEIALQKAKIIHKNNIVVTTHQQQGAERVIEHFTKQQKAHLFTLANGSNFRNININEKQTTFDFNFQELKIGVKLGLIGYHQTENCSLALASTYLLSKRDYFIFHKHVVKKILQRASFPGRLEIKISHKKKVILDGAHNPQKMTSLINALKLLFPGQKFDWLIAFKNGKDYIKMLKIIIPLAQNIFVTQFFSDKQDLTYLSETTTMICQGLKKIGFTHYYQITNPKKALKTALLSNKNNLIISGSLYLISEIYHQINYPSKNSSKF